MASAMFINLLKPILIGDSSALNKIFTPGYKLGQPILASLIPQDGSCSHYTDNSR
jgi:hypothetical protein